MLLYNSKNSRKIFALGKEHSMRIISTVLKTRRYVHFLSIRDKVDKNKSSVSSNMLLFSRSNHIPAEGLESVILVNGNKHKLLFK